jgi:hypothetical protein
VFITTSLKVFVFLYVNGTLSSNIKSRLYNYSAFVSKDLTIFAGKSKNDDGDTLLMALMAGEPGLHRGVGIFPGPFSRQQKRYNNFPQARLAYELLKEKHPGKSCKT